MTTEVYREAFPRTRPPRRRPGMGFFLTAGIVVGASMPLGIALLATHQQKPVELTRLECTLLLDDRIDDHPRESLVHTSLPQRRRVPLLYCAGGAR